MPGVVPARYSASARSGAYTIESSWLPSPKTGQSPHRAALKTAMKLSRSRGP